MTIQPSWELVAEDLDSGANCLSYDYDDSSIASRVVPEEMTEASSMAAINGAMVIKISVGTSTMTPSQDDHDSQQGH